MTFLHTSPHPTPNKKNNNNKTKHKKKQHTHTHTHNYLLVHATPQYRETVFFLVAYLIVLTFSSALVGDKLQRSNSSEAPSLWQPCSGKKRHLNPLCAWEGLFIITIGTCFLLTKKEKARCMNEGMLKPLWNYACKHRRCITQVMRFSSLLKFESPPAPKENKQSPFPTFSFRKMQNATFASSPAPFLPRLLLPTCESGQAVCMQIYCLDDPRPHAHTHTQTHAHWRVEVNNTAVAGKRNLAFPRPPL